MHVLPYLEVIEKSVNRYVRDRTPSDEDLLKYLVEPIHYNVRITNLPNFQSILAKQFDFEGEVVIDLHSRENIDYLLIGANELQVETPTVRKKTFNELVSKLSLVGIYSYKTSKYIIEIQRLYIYRCLYI